MPKGSEQLTAARRDEIISACAKLYETIGYKEITIKEIASFTSFTRPSIYNYFQTKEEIFVAMLQREYERWTDDLNSQQPSGSTGARAELAVCLAHTLERRVMLFRLLSTCLYDIEDNCRTEKLVELKIKFGASIKALDACLGRFCPDMGEDERAQFADMFFPLMNGIYPYAYSTPKQREAIKQAGINFRERTIYDIAYPAIKKFLGI